MIDLVHAQLALECIGFDQSGLLVRIPGPDPDEIARVYIFHYKGDYVIYFRHDVPCSIRQQINALGSQAAYDDQDRVMALLAQHRPCQVACWRTYWFPDALDPRQFPDAVRLTRAHQGLIDGYRPTMSVTQRAVFAVIRDKKIVSTCASVRENEQAGECYVFTVPQYRGHGFARQVTTAWAFHLQAQRKIAFYSHGSDNSASHSVARGLRLKPCFAGVAYS